MAFANSSISDIIATTIQSRSGELADNVTNNNALLRRLKERGNVKKSCTTTRPPTTPIRTAGTKC
jgi:hypothetical protein